MPLAARVVRQQKVFPWFWCLWLGINTLPSSVFLHSTITQWDVQCRGTNFSSSSSLSVLKYSAAPESAMYEDKGPRSERKWLTSTSREGRLRESDDTQKLNYNFSSQNNFWNLLNASEVMIYNLVRRSKVGFSLQVRPPLPPSNKGETHSDLSQTQNKWNFRTYLPVSAQCSSTKPILERLGEVFC